MLLSRPNLMRYYSSLFALILRLCCITTTFGTVNCKSILRINPFTLSLNTQHETTKNMNEHLYITYHYVYIY